MLLICGQTLNVSWMIDYFWDWGNCINKLTILWMWFCLTHHFKSVLQWPVSLLSYTAADYVTLQHHPWVMHNYYSRWFCHYIWSHISYLYPLFPPLMEPIIENHIFSKDWFAHPLLIPKNEEINNRMGTLH